MSRFSRVFASGSSLRFASASVVAALFASLLMLPNTARAQGLYSRPSASLNTGTVPIAVASGDFARSGFQSMAVADSTAKTIKVYLATGAGTFTSAFTYGACNGTPSNTGPTWHHRRRCHQRRLSRPNCGLLGATVDLFQQYGSRQPWPITSCDLHRFESDGDGCGQLFRKHHARPGCCPHWSTSRCSPMSAEPTEPLPPSRHYRRHADRHRGRRLQPRWSSGPCGLR